MEARVAMRHSHPVGLVNRTRRIGVLAPSTQEALDRITYLAGEALDVAAVCASLVDGEQRLLTSSYGLPLPTALLLSHTFRKHVVDSRRPLVVVDGRRDPLVANNPAVRDGTVRACVGMPLCKADGRAVGTLLAMDPKPRPWTAPQLDLLGKLSALIVSEMELGAAVRRASQGDVSSVSMPAR
jgi:GAF domain-containing protein